MSNKKKFSVFISSSYRDFESVRNALIIETLKMDHIPVAMEFFSAGERLNKDFLDHEIQNSDIFVLLLGGRSGSNISENIRFTEFEYDCAVLHSKPIIALLLSDRKFFDIYNSEKLDENEYLINFREKLKKSDRVIEFYDDESEIQAKFNLALFKQVNKITDDRAGYIKSETHTKLNNELASLTKLKGIPKEFISNEITNNIFRDISKFEVSVSRLDKDIPEKQYMGELIWRLLGTSIFFDSNIKKIYIDGSTSCLYLADEYIKFSTERTHSLRVKNFSGSGIVDFYTNAIWIYLNLFFMTEPLYQNLVLFPCPPVSTRYGVCFGEINKLALANSGRFAVENWQLRPDAEDAVGRLTAIMNKLLQGDRGLIFSSSTGLQMADHPVYGGPWSRSYYPSLFKRALLMSDTPVFFVIDGRKWNRRVEDEKPFPVCTKDEWLAFQSEKALGFGITTYLEAKNSEIRQYFSEKGYYILSDSREVMGRVLNLTVALSPKFVAQFKEPLY